MSYGFTIALDRYLSNILSTMINQGILNQDIANRIFGSKDQWAQQFMSMLPANIPESDFQNALYQFLGNLKNQFMGGGYPQQPQSPYGYGSPMPSFGMPSNMNPPRFMIPQQQRPSFPGFQNPIDMGGAPINPFGSTEQQHNTVVKETKEETMEIVPVQYTPAWKNDKSNVIATVEELDGNNALSIYTFPADSTEASFNRYAIKYTHALSTDNAIREFIDTLTNNKERCVSEIQYLNAIVIPISVIDVNKYINEIKQIVNMGGAPSSKLNRLHKYLNTLPRGAYNVFERIVVDRFNRCLKTRIMQNKDNAHLGIKINTFDAILEFIPGNSSIKLDKITSIPDYIVMFENVCKYIYKSILQLSTSEDKSTCVQALKALGGIDAVKNIIAFDSNNETAIQLFFANNTVLTAEEKVVVTNMDITKSFSITEAMNKKCCIHTLSTCALDHILLNIGVVSEPVRVITYTNGIFYCGFTGDNNFIYSI